MSTATFERMAYRRYFTDGLHPFIQLLLLAALMLISSSVFTLLGMYLVRPLFGITALDVVVQAAMENPLMVAENAAQIHALKTVQLMASVGMFLVPALLFAWLKFPDGDYLFLNARPSLIMAGAGTLALLLAVPAVSWLYEWNKTLQLPDALASLQKLLDEAAHANEQLTLAFLATPRQTELFINLIVIALIPALGEELLFRGCIFQLLQEWTRRSHAAVWISAALFSLVHGDLFGFLPRLIMGALLAYLFLWTSNLWVPIIAHAFYNGIQVLLAFLFDHGWIGFDIREESRMSWPVVLVSSVICVAAVYWLNRHVEERKFIY
ncbi:MAG: type II CAAX endopeptidase family protein [Chitinophagales bacterium]|nr:CPBP family intramembrane metalloprotease [Chitinophagales bacterium]MDW8393267.1 type II CAAX endopeptidase family protein [Chitinophagales bacterium]